MIFFKILNFHISMIGKVTVMFPDYKTFQGVVGRLHTDAGYVLMIRQ